jgi:hypothetical protein
MFAHWISYLGIIGKAKASKYSFMQPSEGERPCKPTESQLDKIPLWITIAKKNTKVYYTVRYQSSRKEACN